MTEYEKTELVNMVETAYKQILPLYNYPPVKRETIEKGLTLEKAQEFAKILDSQDEQKGLSFLRELYTNVLHKMEITDALHELCKENIIDYGVDKSGGIVYWFTEKGKQFRRERKIPDSNKNNPLEVIGLKLI